MSIIGTSKPKTAPKLDAQEALSLAVEWAEQRRQDTYGSPISGADLALISIAASLREIAGKLR